MQFTEWAFLLFFLGAAFFFAMAETALLTLGQWRLRQVTAQNPGCGTFIRKLLAEPQDLLATMTLGNTLAQQRRARRRALSHRQGTGRYRHRLPASGTRQ